MNKIILTALCGAFLISSFSMKAHCKGIDQIIMPDKYINSDSLIRVETSEDDEKSLESIRVKLDHSAYADITDTKTFSVNKNCTAYVKIRYRDKNGNDETVELEKEINNFDGIAPKVSAFIKGEEMTIRISDDISGPDLINVEGMNYTQFNDGMISINLKELENTKEYFTIYATDNASNRTNTLRVYNPYYVGEDKKNGSDKGVDNPQSNDATKPTDATAQIISHTDEDGDDLMNVSYKNWKGNDASNGSKQFFTIKTKSDKVFYIVVDESYDSQTAYLLTEAGENDLLNFVNYDGNSIDTGETTVYTIPGSDRKETAENIMQTDEPANKQKTEKKPLLALILILAIAGGGAYYYRLKKNKESDEDEYPDDDDFEQADDDQNYS